MDIDPIEKKSGKRLIGSGVVPELGKNHTFVFKKITEFTCNHNKPMQHTTDGITKVRSNTKYMLTDAVRSQLDITERNSKS